MATAPATTTSASTTVEIVTAMTMSTTNASDDTDTNDHGKCQVDSWLIMTGILIQICYYNFDYLKFKTVWNGL